MASSVRSEKELQLLQKQAREAMRKSDEARMTLVTACAAFIAGWGPPPTAAQVRRADHRGAEAEERWRRLDDALRSSLEPAADREHPRT